MRESLGEVGFEGGEGVGRSESKRAKLAEGEEAAAGGEGVEGEERLEGGVHGGMCLWGGSGVEWRGRE